MSRWIRFIIAIFIGIAAGLVYGWVISPVEYVNTTPDTLRIDYKTDYVLMVAEAYTSNTDLGLAKDRLSLLTKDNPNKMVLETIVFAERNGYTDADLRQMRTLSEALLQEQAPNTGTAAP